MAGGQNDVGISTLTKQAFDDDDIFDVSVWNSYPNYDDWNKDSQNLFSYFPQMRWLLASLSRLGIFV